MLPATADHAVKLFKTLFTPLPWLGIGLEMPVAKRQSYMIKPQGPDASDVGFGEIVLHVGIPKRRSLLRPEPLREGRAHYIVNLRQADHEMLNQHPVAQSDATQLDRFPPGDQGAALYPQPLGRSLDESCLLRLFRLAAPPLGAVQLSTGQEGKGDYDAAARPTQKPQPARVVPGVD